MSTTHPAAPRVGSLRGGYPDRTARMDGHRRELAEKVAAANTRVQHKPAESGTHA